MTMTHNVSIVIEKDDDGYYASCPELDGCQTQGDTVEEVLANINEAIELYLETLAPQGTPAYRLYLHQSIPRASLKSLQ